MYEKQPVQIIEAETTNMMDRIFATLGHLTHGRSAAGPLAG